jgi:hypothetical protein
VDCGSALEMLMPVAYPAFARAFRASG